VAVVNWRRRKAQQVNTKEEVEGGGGIRGG
jgi:hypothetical protein